MARKAFMAATLATIAGIASLAEGTISQTAPANASAGGIGGWNGVGRLRFSFPVPGGTAISTATGTLISNRHILTAAHVIPPTVAANGKFPAGTTSKFHLPEQPGNGIFNGARVAVHPNWTGSVTAGGDVAIITLSRPIAAATFWAINSGQIAEAGVTATKIGWGSGGGGALGENTNTFPAGRVKRGGTNVIDFIPTHNVPSGVYTIPAANAEGANPVSSAIPRGTIVFDFDQAGAAAGHVSNRLGAQVGAGVNEVNTARGDSGGPMFAMDGGGTWRIIGITSYGFDFGMQNPAPKPGRNPFFSGGSQFGDISVDTRVSRYAGWINNHIPAPSSLALLGLGGMVMARRVRRNG